MPATQEGATHEFGAVCFHYFAIRVESREKVDEMYAWCKDKQVVVIDPPAEYPQYSSEYYSVFFLDPDGLKL